MTSKHMRILKHKARKAARRAELALQMGHLRTVAMEEEKAKRLSDELSRLGSGQKTGGGRGPVGREKDKSGQKAVAMIMGVNSYKEAALH